MKRIRTLGLCAVMALALTAFVGVSAASANSFKAAVTPSAWNGSLSGKNHALSLNGSNFSCSQVSFSGQLVGNTQPEVTVSPEIAGCSFLGTAVTWQMNGCQYNFRAGPGSALVGSLDIVNCKSPMTLIVPEIGCRIEIGNQKGLGTVTYSNVAGSPTTVKAIANLNSITFTRNASCFATAGTFNNGTYTGEWTVKGATVPGGVPAGVEIESTLPAPLSTFVAEEAPATISGVGGGGKTIMPLGGNGTTCTSFTLSGTMASTVAKSLVLVPTYKGCTVGGEAVPDGFVNAGSCHFVFHVNGNFDIAGENCASNPMAITRAGCVATIGPQSLSGVSYTISGSGRLRTVSTSGAISNVAFSLTGPSCAFQGPGTEGKLLSTSKLTATNAGGGLQGLSME